MRIISGAARGKTISAPKGIKTRPTIERVREAIFSVLSPYLAGAVVLDAFAGSGALGLEALSRGAERAVFCDMDHQALSVIRKNIAACGFQDKADIYAGDSLQSISRLSGFDLVLLDPPYNRGLIARLEPLLLKEDFLRSEALVMLETSAKQPELFLSDNWQLYKNKVYGDTAVYYFGLKQYGD